MLWLVPIGLILYWIGYENSWPGSGSPLHASCKINWEWSDNQCSEIHEKLINQIKLWTPEDNCAGGGQKCLYELIEETSDYIKATHTTPIKRYVDTLTFKFTTNNNGCNVLAFSSSDLWYAILDYGTNYCNLENLLTGAGLDQIPGFIETTSNRVCTQYDSRNCT